MPCPFIAKEKHNISILNLNNVNLILNTINMKKKHFKAVGELFKPLLKGLLSAVVLGVTLSTAMAQEREVTGSILDENGEGLPGVTIIIKGTTSGTISDFNGIYKLNLSEEGSALVFSALGYDTQEITVGSRSVIDISMTANVSELEEIVVTGYTSQSKKSVTGAVGTVDIGEATKVPMLNAAEALQGRVTGVTVTNNGEPGGVPNIRIRGYGTTNNNDPLYIIDGVQTTDAYVLNTINPSDILQMNVLKDGAASIYGARASNGVVIITTKSGSYGSGKVKLTAEAYFGSQRAINLPEVLNAQQHGDMLFQSYANDGEAWGHQQYGSDASGAIIPSVIQGTPGDIVMNVAPGGTNWMKELYRDAPVKNYAISASGGSESAKFMMSLQYQDRDGIQVATNYDRVSTRLNGEFTVKDRVRIGQHMNVSFENGSTANNHENALRASPLMPVYDADGDFGGPYAGLGLGNSSGPVSEQMATKDNYNKTLRAVGDVYLEADLLENLTFKTSAGINYRQFEQRGFAPSNPYAETPRADPILYHGEQSNYEWVFSNTLNYNKTFGEHSLGILVGTEAVYNTFRFMSLQRSGFLFEDPDFYFLTNGSNDPVITGSGETDYALSSYFGNLNYSFRDRYFFSMSVRNDKTSRFSQANASATFPSLSAAWIVSEEAFFPRGVISNLKVKGSWGKLGNQSLSITNPDVNQSSLNDNLAYYVFNGSGTPTTGALLSQLGNKDLKWETTTSINVGVELGFLNDKLSVNFDWFDITTNDLIAQDLTTITTTAIDANAPYVNIGEVNNTGIELAIGYADQTSSGFSYGVDLIFSSYDNEVTQLASEFQVGGGFRNGNNATRTEVGQPISSFYGRQVIGIFETQAEVDASGQAGAGVGRFQYADINDDGVVDDEDRTYIGSPHADFTYGLNLNVGFKGFDVSAFFSGSQGNDAYNVLKIYTDFPSFVDLNRSTRVLDSWTPTNTGASLPQLSAGAASSGNNETNSNSYYVEDASYFRLKNLQIGYTLPSSISSKLAMDNARIYVQGTNLFTLTDYNGADPEIQESGTLGLGVDYGKFPQSRILSVGFKFNF
jgi:TonB-linked SusC/RagA family outer membrane protein